MNQVEGVAETVQTSKEEVLAIQEKAKMIERFVSKSRFLESKLDSADEATLHSILQRKDDNREQILKSVADLKQGANTLSNLADPLLL